MHERAGLNTFALESRCNSTNKMVELSEFILFALYPYHVNFLEVQPEIAGVSRACIESPSSRRGARGEHMCIGESVHYPSLRALH